MLTYKAAESLLSLKKSFLLHNTPQYFSNAAVTLAQAKAADSGYSENAISVFVYSTATFPLANAPMTNTAGSPGLTTSGTKLSK